MLDLIMKFLNLDGKGKDINESALGEGMQLLSDAITLNRSEYRSSAKNLAGYQREKTTLDKLAAKSKLYKAITNDRNVEQVQTVLESLLEYADELSGEEGDNLRILVNVIMQDESNTFGSVSKFSKFMAFVATNELADINKENISFNGVYSEEFIDTFIDWLVDNMDKYYEFVPVNSEIQFNKRYTDLILIGNDIFSTPITRIDGKPYATIKLNESFGKDAYLLLDPENKSNRVIISNSPEGDIVFLKNGSFKKKVTSSKGVVAYTNYKPESDIELPPNFKIYAKREYNKLRDAYDNDERKIQDRINMVVSKFQEAMSKWQKEKPELSREDIIREKGLEGISKYLYDWFKLNRDDEGLTPSEVAEWNKVLGNIDLLLESAIPIIELIEGVTLYEKGKKINKKEAELVPTEESENIDEEIETLENQPTERYLIKKDSKSMVTRLSKEVLRELHNLSYPTDHPDDYDDLYYLRNVPVEQAKDALLDVLSQMNSAEELIPRLRQGLEKYPFLITLIHKLKNDPTLKIIFYNNFNLFRVKSLVINEYAPKYRVTRASEIAERDATIDGWKENILGGNVVGHKYSTYGTGTNIDSGKFIKAVDRFEKDLIKIEEAIIALKELKKKKDDFNFNEEMKKFDKNPENYALKSSNYKTYKELLEKHIEQVSEDLGINEDYSAMYANTVEEMIPLISDMLNSLGINITQKDVRIMYNKTFLNKGEDARGLDYVLREYKNIGDKLKDLASSLQVGNITKVTLIHNLDNFYKIIYRIYSSTVPTGGENVVTVDGDTYYLDRESSYIGRLVKKINIDHSGIFGKEQRDKFFMDTWGRMIGRYSYMTKDGIRYYSRLLNDLYNNTNNAADVFEYYTLIKYNGKKWQDLADNDVLKMRVAAYLQLRPDSAYTYFMLPTISDSPELGFFMMKRYKDIEDGGPVITAKAQILDNLYNLYLGELNQLNFLIRQHKLKQSGSLEYNPNIEIKNFFREIKDGDKVRLAISFKNFPFLNKLLTSEVLDEAYERGYLRFEKSTIQTAFREYLDSQFELFLDAFTEKDMFGKPIKVEGGRNKLLAPELFNEATAKVEFNKDFFYKLYANLSQDELYKLYSDYFYNDYNASAEILNLLGTDPAFYKNGIDHQKRFKEVYTGGQALDTTASLYSYEYNPETGKYTRKSTPEVAGKQYRNTLVVKDLHTVSAIPMEMLRSLKATFSKYDELVDAAKTLGVYNRVEKKVTTGKNKGQYVQVLDEQNHIVSYYKGKKTITKEEYDSVQGEEKHFFAVKQGKKTYKYPISKLNLTDGQTLISMAEARAVAIMAGKHSVDAEKAFVKFKTTQKKEDFETAMNNIKSFYYGDEYIETGDPDMPFIKNNVQFKHAENIVLLSKMLDSSPLLKAISDFLNEGFFDGNKTHNIDAISFDSTQKVGQRNVIELDINASYDDIMTTLREAAIEREGGIGNKFITTDYNNYVIQQPTPNHIIDNTDQMIGTQIRNVTISDIPNNASINVNGRELSKDEFVKAFNSIVNKKIQENFQQLKEEFSDNRRLSDLFVRTIESNARYSKNLKNYFTLNEEGEFNIPLFAPQNSILVHQMIMSIIGKNIIKHKIRGGKVINNTNLGFSDDLKIEFDSNNNPTYFEVAMPFYGSTEQYNDMLDENGNFDMSRVDKKLLEGVFYRIPTEKHYSAYVVKVKTFLPPAQGVNIMFPSELSALSGIDFDIDAMYGFLYDYFVQEDGDSIRLVAKKSTDVDEILNAADSFILPNSDIQKVNDYFEKKQNRGLDSYFDALYSDYFENVDNEMNRRKGIEPTTSPETTGTVIEETITPETNEEVIEENPESETSDDNLFIDMVIQSIISPHNARNRLKGSNFDNLVEIGSERKLAELGYTEEQIQAMSAREKEDTVNDVEYDLNNPLTHEYFMTSNRNSAGNIGIFINRASFHNKMTSIKDARLVPSYGDKNSGSKLAILKSLFNLSPEQDIVFSDISVLDEMDDEIYISDMIAEDVTASVDGTKRPSHSLMGVNRGNINIYSALTLIGLDRKKSMNILSFMNLKYNYRLISSINNRFNGYELYSSFKNIERATELVERILEVLPKDLTGYTPISLVEHLTELNKDKNSKFYDAVNETIGDSLHKNKSLNIFLGLIYITETLQNFSYVVTNNVLSTRYDLTNARPKESLSYMVRAIKQREKVLYGLDMSFRIQYSNDFKYNFSNQFFEYAYKEMARVLGKALNIQAQGNVYSILPEISAKVSERVIRTAYTNYMLERLNVPNYGKLDSNFVAMFPNYALSVISSNEKLKNLSLFQSLATVRNELVLLKDSVPNKDIFISNWDTAYRDSETKDFAMMLAMYSIYKDGFEFGSTRLGYFIPPVIMHDMGVFSEIQQDPKSFYKYINLELLTPVADSNFTVGDDYLAHRYKRLGLKYNPKDLLSGIIEEILPKEILDEILTNYKKYANGRVVHDKMITFTLGGTKINALVTEDNLTGTRLISLKGLEKELGITCLSTKQQAIKEDAKLRNTEANKHKVDDIFIDEYHQRAVKEALNSEPKILNELYVEEVLFSNNDLARIDKLGNINRNIQDLKQSIMDEYAKNKDTELDVSLSESEISRLQEDIIEDSKYLSYLTREMSTEENDAAIQELIDNIKGCL